MQSAEAVLDILRERGRRNLPCNELYRQMFNPQLYLLAHGRLYSNKGAMTPGASEETADGMSEDKIDQIIEAMRHERYRFSPVRRIYIPKKNGKLRPLGLPSWSDKLVGEVVRPMALPLARSGRRQWIWMRRVTRTTLGRSLRAGKSPAFLVARGLARLGRLRTKKAGSRILSRKVARARSSS